MKSVIDKITNEIWNQGKEVMENGNRRMTNAEFIMIYHCDNKLKLGKWGNLGCPIDSVTNAIIRTWYNYTYLKRDIRNQVEEFIEYCKQEGLEISYI